MPYDDKTGPPPRRVGPSQETLDALAARLEEMYAEEMAAPPPEAPEESTAQRDYMVRLESAIGEVDHLRSAVGLNYMSQRRAARDRFLTSVRGALSDLPGLPGKKEAPDDGGFSDATGEPVSVPRQR